MTDDRPFGPMDPNSQHQRWSRWVFGVEASPSKRPSVKECVDNARRYFAKAFQSTVGRVRCDAQGTYYCFVVEIEGPPAHDPEYVRALKADITERFLRPGFGPSVQLVRCEVGLLAGDTEDGTPPEQFLVVPQLPVTTALYVS